MKNIWNQLMDGIIRQNPVLVQLIGMCPTLAVSTTLENGVGMGLAATAVLICSNIAISLLRKIIPNKVRIAAYIVVIAGFVTMVDLLLQAFAPELSKSLGLFIPLIVVNCIILARAEAFASRNSVGLSALDGLGMGAGFTGALVAMGLIRELLGNGTVFGWPEGGLFPAITIFVLPAGGFFVFGILIWLTNQLSHKFDKDTAREELSGQVCAACPMTGTCHGAEGCKPASSAANPDGDRKGDESHA